MRQHKQWRVVLGAEKAPAVGARVAICQHDLHSPLNHNGFLTLAYAAKKSKTWRECCSEERPHGGREQAPDQADRIRGNNQAVTLNEAGKLCVGAVQCWGAEHQLIEARITRKKVGAQVTSTPP